jgi:Acetyltransferase (GNAT) domain
MPACQDPFEVQGVLSSSAPARPPDFDIRIVTSVRDMEGLRPSWTSWKGHRDSDIDFFLNLVQSSERVIRPHVIVLYRAGRPDAILVGRLERASMDFKLGYFHLPSVPVRELIFSYGGFRGNTCAENSTQMVLSILESLRRREADLAMLHQVDASSALYEKALRVPGALIRDRFATAAARYLMTLPDNVEQLYKGFSQGLRAELRRKKRRLLADFDGKLVVRRIRNAKELDSAFPDLEEIAGKTYQRGLGFGFEDTPEVRGRFRFCAEKGWLRVYIVYIDGRPSSFWTGTVKDGAFASDDVGYDPYFREYSLGSFVLITLLEDLCREGVGEVDFGPGLAEYKKRFSNRSTMEASVLIFAPTMRGIGLNSLRTITTVTDRTGKAMLERTNLLPRVKRFWRSRAAQDNAGGRPSQPV